MKNVLLIHQDIKLNNSHSCIQTKYELLIKKLLGFQYLTTVIYGKNAKAPTAANNHHAEPNYYRKVAIPLLNEKRRVGVIRLINWFYFALRLIIYFYKTPVPDIIIFSSMPQLPIISIKLGFLCRRKPYLITEIRDIWPLTGICNLNLKPNSIFCLVSKYCDFLIIQMSDLVISPIKNLDKYYARTFDKVVNVLYFPNQIIYQKEVQPDKKTTTQSTKFRNHIGFFGKIGAGNNVQDFLPILSHNHNMKLHIYSDHIAPNLYKYPNVKIFPAVDRETALELMSRYQYLLMCTPPKTVYHYGLCSLKYYDYIQSGSAIIHCSEEKVNINTNELGPLGIYWEQSIEKNIAKLIHLSEFTESDLNSFAQIQKSNMCKSNNIGKSIAQLIKKLDKSLVEIK